MKSRYMRLLRDKGYFYKFLYKYWEVGRMESGGSMDCGEKSIYYGNNRTNAVKLYSSLLRVYLM